MRYLDRFADAMRASYTPGEDDPWWYDNAMHFAGGAVTGAPLFLLGVSLVDAVSVFLVLATVWEMFEYQYNIRPWDERENWSTDRAIEDTILDTYIGLTGLAVTYLTVPLLV